MKKIIALFLSVLLLSFCFAACSNGSEYPSDGKAASLAKKALEITALYSQGDMTQAVKQEFKDVKFGDESDGYVESNLKYSEVKDKYASVFSENTLEYFLSVILKEENGAVYIPKRNLDSQSRQISNVKATFFKKDKNGNPVYRVEYDTTSADGKTHLNREITFIKEADGYKADIETIAFNEFQNALA